MIKTDLKCSCVNCEFGFDVDGYNTKFVCASHDSEYSYGQEFTLDEVEEDLKCWSPSLNFFIGSISPLVKEVGEGDKIHDPNYSMVDLIELLEGYYILPEGLKRLLQSV